MKKIYFLLLITLLLSCMSNKPYEPDFSTEEGRSDFARKAWIQSQDFVKQELKSPSTAEFPFTNYSYSNPSKIDNSITIKSFVDAENAFGATIRQTFFITLKYNGGEWEDINNWAIVDLKFQSN